MKKLYMKSLISLVLILVIGLLRSQDVVAQDVKTKSIEFERLFFDDLEVMLKQIMGNQDVYHTSIRGNLKILSPITINVPNGSTGYQVVHLPIMDETDKVVLIYSIINTDKGVSTSIGPAFSKMGKFSECNRESHDCL